MRSPEIQETELNECSRVNSGRGRVGKGSGVEDSKRRLEKRHEAVSRGSHRLRKRRIRIETAWTVLKREATVPGGSGSLS